MAERSGSVLRMVPAAAALRLVRTVAVRPGLWRPALRQLRRTSAPGWWRRSPFLPLPPADYAAFRLQTMYGGSGRLPADAADRMVDDLVGWLTWTETVAPPAGRRR